MIEIRDVSKQYGGKHGIHEISLGIEKGRITSLIGPNGAGKSTLLGVMSRLAPADAGRILIDGMDVAKTDSAKLARTVSILKQSNPMTVRLTVRDLVEFGRFPHSQGRLNAEDKRHVDEAIAYMELGDLQHRYLDLLSGGQRQRAFIAMTLAQDTDYILLDEPLNNLDMKHAVQIMKVLRTLTDELGKTVVLVLHDINFASCYSDRIVAMKDGRVAREGTADELVDSAVLKDVYEMDIPVHTVDGNKICVYFA